MVTASSEKAVRRSSSESKRWRQMVRVSVVIGEAKIPAAIAQPLIAAKGRPSFAAASMPASASGWITPVTINRRRGP